MKRLFIGLLFAIFMGSLAMEKDKVKQPYTYDQVSDVIHYLLLKHPNCEALEKIQNKCLISFERREYLTSITNGYRGKPFSSSQNLTSECDEFLRRALSFHTFFVKFVENQKSS